MSDLFERLMAAVPGVGARSTRREVLQATLSYVHAVQSVVGAGAQRAATDSPDSLMSARSWASCDDRGSPRHWADLTSAVHHKWVTEHHDHHAGGLQPEYARKIGGQ